MYSYTGNGSLFGRYAKATAIGRGNVEAAAGYARSQNWGADTAPIVAALQRAAAAVTTQDYAQALGPIGVDFAEFLRPQTLTGRITGMREAAFLVHHIDEATGTVASFVEEGNSIAVSAASFEGTVYLRPAKVAVIVAISDTLARLSTPKAERILTADVARAMALGVDIAFIDPSNAGTVEIPASITHGAPTFTSTGSALANVDADLQTLVASLTDSSVGLELGFWVMPSRTAAHMALMRGSGGALAFPGLSARGGVLLGLPVLTSNAAIVGGSPSDGMIVLADADSLFYADDGESEIDISNTASLQLSDSPLTGARPLVSLWQNNLIAIKGKRYCRWHRRRPNGVAVLRGVTF